METLQIIAMMTINLSRSNCGAIFSSLVNACNIYFFLEVRSTGVNNDRDEIISCVCDDR